MTTWFIDHSGNVTAHSNLDSAVAYLSLQRVPETVPEPRPWPTPAVIHSHQLRGFTAEEAAEEFGFEPSDFSKPGIYSWLSEMGSVSDFDYHGNVDRLALDTPAQCVHHLVSQDLTQREARESVRQFYGVEFEDGVAIFCPWEECVGLKHIRIVAA